MTERRTPVAQPGRQYFTIDLVSMVTVVSVQRFDTNSTEASFGNTRWDELGIKSCPCSLSSLHPTAISSNRLKPSLRIRLFHSFINEIVHHPRYCCPRGLYRFCRRDILSRYRARKLQHHHLPIDSKPHCLRILPSLW
jgi:hypothetical protein